MGEVGLTALFLRLRLLQLGLVGQRLDGEEVGAAFDEGTVSISDVLQEAFDAGDEIDGVHRARIAGRFEIERDGLPQRRRDVHLGRRRRGVVVLLLAGGKESEPEKGGYEAERLAMAHAVSVRSAGHSARLTDGTA